MSSFMRSDDNEDAGNGSRRSTPQTQGDISVRAADGYTIMSGTADGAPRAVSYLSPGSWYVIRCETPCFLFNTYMVLNVQ